MAESSSAPAADTASQTPAASESATPASESATPTSESATPTSESPAATSESPASTSASPTSDTPSSSSASPSSSSSSPDSTSSPSPTSSPASASSSSASASDSSSSITTTIESTSSGSSGPSTIVITSTEAVKAHPSSSASTTGSPNSTGAANLPSTENKATSHGGIGTGGTIAVAVVVPVVGVALLLLAAFWLWKRRNATKAAEEERRKEVEEYSFNPNNDPSLPPVGMVQDDTSGYRGWGATSIGRHPSTTLSGGAGGLTRSDNGSPPGYHHAPSPSDDTIQFSDGHGRQPSGDTEPIGILGAAPAASGNRNGDIHRGPSNASSAYSTANRSEGSEDSHISAAHPSGHFYDDNPFYNDVQQQYGSYADSTPYAGSPPVIRDVQARRNTRIESPAVFPRQGNAGISQNF